MQIAWIPLNGEEDGEKVLHIRLVVTDRWQPYTNFPKLKVPDLQIPGLRNGKPSKGFTTMQSLLSKGFKMVPTCEAMGRLRDRAVSEP